MCLLVQPASPALSFISNSHTQAKKQAHSSFSKIDLSMSVLGETVHGGCLGEMCTVCTCSGGGGVGTEGDCRLFPHSSYNSYCLYLCLRALPAVARPALWHTWLLRQAISLCASTTTSTQTCRSTWAAGCQMNKVRGGGEEVGRYLLSYGHKQLTV